MRRSVVVAVAAVLGLMSLACSGTAEPLTAPETPASPSLSASPTVSPKFVRHGPLDLVPRAMNTPGFPACGFFTRDVPDLGDDTLFYRYVLIGIAVKPVTPSGEPIDPPGSPYTMVDYKVSDADPEYPNQPLDFTQDFDPDGNPVNSYWQLPGTSATYYAASEQADWVLIGFTANGKWTSNRRYDWSHWLTQNHTITVTVDPGNSIDETDETNNTMTLRMHAKKAQTTLDITDNICTIV